MIEFNPENLLPFSQAYGGMKLGKVFMAYREYTRLPSIYTANAGWTEIHALKMIGNEIHYFSHEKLTFQKYKKGDFFEALNSFMSLRYKEIENPELDPAIIAKRLDKLEGGLPGNNKSMAEKDNCEIYDSNESSFWNDFFATIIVIFILSLLIAGGYQVFEWIFK